MRQPPHIDCRNTPPSIPAEERSRTPSCNTSEPLGDRQGANPSSRRYCIRDHRSRRTGPRRADKSYPLGCPSMDPSSHLCPRSWDFQKTHQTRRNITRPPAPKPNRKPKVKSLIFSRFGKYVQGARPYRATCKILRSPCTKTRAPPLNRLEHRCRGTDDPDMDRFPRNTVSKIHQSWRSRAGVPS